MRQAKTILGSRGVGEENKMYLAPSINVFMEVKVY